MSNNRKVTHLTGRYMILVAVIGFAAVIYQTRCSNKNKPNEMPATSLSIQAQSPSQSPVANKIENQTNNYYNNSSTTNNMSSKQEAKNSYSTQPSSEQATGNLEKRRENYQDQKLQSPAKSCPPWYEGDNCDREMRQKFFGHYSGIMYDQDNHFAPMSVTVTLSAGHDGIQSIYIFWCVGNDGKPLAWNTSLIDANKIIVSPQAINNNPILPKGTSYIDAGSGILSGSSLTLTYTSSNQNGTVRWSGTLNK